MNANPSPAETFVGSNVDVRTVLHFQAADDAVRALLPSGWYLAPAASGPAAGANLRITMIETVAAHDARGEPRTAVSYMHAGIPVRASSGQAGLMLFTGLSPAAPGPYGTNLPATVHLERASRHDAGGTVCEESWSLLSPGGASARLRLSFQRGALLREAATLHVYSRVKAGFHRIYRYEQSIDVLGVPGHASRLRDFEFEVAGESFERVFDGRERLLGIVAVPSYSRRIFLPESARQ